MGLPEAEEDLEVEPRDGDRFLGLTWSPHAIPLAHAALREFSARGVRINIVVYDLLPQQHPEWFPFGLPQQHLGWLISAAATADRLICISRDVAGELARWLGEYGPQRRTPLRIAHFPLGCDIEASAATSGLPDGNAGLVEALRSRKTFLMVGTVEPRKGHRQAIAAFDTLWRDGHRHGAVDRRQAWWMAEDLEVAVAAHPEFGRRLVRIDDASDEFLATLYAHAAALLAPSQGEGFGLPIVEAARHQVAVIARDLPVFREVAGDGGVLLPRRRAGRPGRRHPRLARTCKGGRASRFRGDPLPQLVRIDGAADGRSRRRRRLRDVAVVAGSRLRRAGGGPARLRHRLLAPGLATGGDVCNRPFSRRNPGAAGRTQALRRRS